MTKNQGELTMPVVAALAIIRKDNQLLLVQRSKEPQKYGWGFPGGSVNAGETLHDAARRELLEETQIQGTPEKTLEVIEVNEFDSQGKHYHFILVPVLCHYVSGTPIASDDAMDCKWVAMQEILSNPSEFIDHVAPLTRSISHQLA